jgi:hypothetical protein
VREADQNLGDLFRSLFLDPVPGPREDDVPGEGCSWLPGTKLTGDALFTAFADEDHDLRRR